MGGSEDKGVRKQRSRMHEEFEALCGPARLPDLGRRLERAQRRERGLGEAGVREVVDEQVEELHVRLLQLGDDSVDGLARLVDGGADSDHQYLVLDATIANLKRRERREEDLSWECASICPDCGVAKAT